MRRQLTAALFVASLLPWSVGGASALPVPRLVYVQQQVPDCSNCSQADWGREWHPEHQNCTYNPMVGCGQGCNCFLSFMAVITVENGKATARMDFFGGAFVRDEKGAITGFRIDRPGPLARNRVQAGDVIHRLNGRRVTRALLTRFTEKRPIRRARATWNEQGQLLLTLQR